MSTSKIHFHWFVHVHFTFLLELGSGLVEPQEYSEGKSQGKLPMLSFHIISYAFTRLNLSTYNVKIDIPATFLKIIDIIISKGGTTNCTPTRR